MWTMVLMSVASAASASAAAPATAAAAAATAAPATAATLVANLTSAAAASSSSSATSALQALLSSSVWITAQTTWTALTDAIAHHLHACDSASSPFSSLASLSSASWPTLALATLALFFTLVALLWATVFLFYYLQAMSHYSPSTHGAFAVNSTALTTPTTIAHYTDESAKLSSVEDVLQTSSGDVTQLPPTDVAIVGCGVAGAALCAALARRGYTVRCVERSMQEPHRIVGELLQPGGVKNLAQLGLLDTLEGLDAQDITGYTIMLHGKTLRLPYPHMYGDAVRGRAFHNGRFVMSLRRAALAESRCEVIEGSVKQLVERTSDGRVVGIEFEDGKTSQKMFAPAALTIVCDGCFSSLRRPLVETEAKKLSSFLGLVLKDCKLPTAQNGHVILANPTPVLVYPISSTEARMLIDFPDTMPSQQCDKETRVSALSEKLLRDVQPQLPPSIQDSFVNAVREHKFQSMPNQSMCARPAEKSGVVLIGDSVNMRHPLTGGGMTVAFSDCVSLLKHLQHVRDMNHEETLDAAVHRHYASRDAPVSVINMLADALYAVFCEKYDLLRVSCFNYLSLKGPFSDGPVRLLSGVAASQTLLLVHFFSVALYGVVCSFFPFPTPASLYACVQTLRTAVHIITPLIVQENRSSWFMRGFVSAARTVFWV